MDSATASSEGRRAARSTAARDSPKHHHGSSCRSALADPARIKIVRVIGRDRAVTSQDLRVLREAGGIAAKRRGNIVRYTLSQDVSGSIIEEAASVFDQLQPETAPAT